MSNRRLPIYILADCSGSMTGAPIEMLKNGILDMRSELLDQIDVVEKAWLSVITFNSTVSVPAPLAELAQFNPPQALEAKGQTNLGAALQELASRIRSEVKQNDPLREVKGDHKPLAFIVTDGAATDDWQSGLRELQKLGGLKPCVIGVACGEQADVSMLRQIVSRDKDSNEELLIVMKDKSPGAFKKCFKAMTQLASQPRDEVAPVPTTTGFSVSPPSESSGGAEPPPPPPPPDPTGNTDTQGPVSFGGSGSPFSIQTP